MTQSGAAHPRELVGVNVRRYKCSDCGTIPSLIRVRAKPGDRGPLEDLIRAQLHGRAA